MKEDLQRWVYQLRIDATVEVVELSDAEITMDAYERTMLMEDRARLALNLSMGGKKSSVDPVIAQHLRETINSYLPPTTSGDNNKQGADAGLLFMPETVIQIPDIDEKNRKSSPKKHRRVKIKLNDKTLDCQDYENGHTTRRRYRRCNSFSSSSSSLADSECGPKQGGERTGGMPGKDNKAFEPDVNDTFEELRSKWLSSGRQLRRSSDMPSKTVRDFAKNRLTEKRNSLFYSHSGAELSDDGSIGGHASRTVDEEKRIAKEERFSKLDGNKLRKMHTALKMNRLIKEKSSTGCRLYVLNLPRPPHSREGLVYYMEYLEALTDGLERVLLVRGSGKEVITIY
uniref:SLC12A transporter C-terminal domain-containing protein n=1 Tax=Romanomermis culicivorax TaxID=13658 RepID=A0A915JEN2_ROMCU